MAKLPSPANVPEKYLSLANDIARKYSVLPTVESVTLAGSLTAGNGSNDSDVDLHVYASSEVAISKRKEIVTGRGATRLEINNSTWERGDEWLEPNGTHIDVVFREKTWIQNQLDKVLKLHEASVGYSTCFWHAVLTSVILFDHHDWFKDIQKTSHSPYPEMLRLNIVEKNHPILRDSISSYRQQIAKAVSRNDLNSLNHRIAAFLASYFDILFAINRYPHPGEKRLLELVEKHCPLKPNHFDQNIEELLQASSHVSAKALTQIDTLMEGLDVILSQEKLLPVSTAESD